MFKELISQETFHPIVGVLVGLTIVVHIAIVQVHVACVRAYTSEELHFSLARVLSIKDYVRARKTNLNSH